LARAPRLLELARAVRRLREQHPGEGDVAPRPAAREELERLGERGPRLDEPAEADERAAEIEDRDGAKRVVAERPEPLRRLAGEPLGEPHAADLAGDVGEERERRRDLPDVAGGARQAARPRLVAPGRARAAR